jgi:hypothetical protein
MPYINTAPIRNAVVRGVQQARGWLPILAVLTVAGFWGIILTDRSDMRTLARLLSERRLPHLLAGLKLDFGSTMRIADSRAPWPPGRGRLVIITTSDTCFHCKQAAPQMCDFLKQGSLPVADSLLFVTFDTPSIPQYLAGCARVASSQRDVRIGRVAGRLGFAARTGITATPTVVIAGRDLTVIGSCLGGDLTHCAPLVHRTGTGVD